MASLRWGRAFVAQSLLLFALAAPAPAAFEIRDSRLFRDGERFLIRGVVYSNTPIRHAWTDTITAAGCLYTRDFPLIQTVVLWVALITIVINIVVDLSYAWLDPRVRYGAGR